MSSLQTPQSSEVILGQRMRSESENTVKTSTSSASAFNQIGLKNNAVPKEKPHVTQEISDISISRPESSSSEIQSQRGETDAVIGVACIDAERKKVPKGMGWVATAILMVAETMSLGIMSLPQAMNTLGLIIGPLLIVFFGLLSFFCGLLLWKVKRKQRKVASYCDMLTRMFGETGKWISTLNNGTMLIFVMAGHIITWAEMIRVLASNKTPCLVLIKAAGACLMAVLSLPKFLRSSMPLYYAAAASIITAAIILMIDGAVLHHDLGAKTAFIIVPLHMLKASVVASTISNVMIAYAGHMAYFQIMDEMRNVDDFWKSLSLAGGIISLQYLSIAVVVYKYYGQDVASPALSSASSIVRKVAWAISIPTILVAGVIAAYIFNKDILLLIWKKQQLHHLKDLGKAESPQKGAEEKGPEESCQTVQTSIEAGDNALPMISTKKEWTARILIDIATWTGAFVLANVIPGFSNLLALLGALVGWSIVIGQPALMWLWVEWNPIRIEEHGEKILWKQSIRRSFFQNRRSGLWFWFCIFMLVLWPVAAVTGVWGSALLIKAADEKRGVFACRTDVR